MSFIKKLIGADVDTPRDRKYGEELEGNLQGQRQVVPQLLASEQEYRPQFAGLDYGIMRDLFSGGQFYEEDLLPGLQRASEAASDIAVEGDIGRMGRLGGRGIETFLEANPLLKQLYGTAQKGIEGGLPADYKRQVQQEIRESQAARGMGYSPSDAAAEASLVGRERENYLMGRRAEAMQTQREAALPMLQALYGNSVSIPEATQTAAFTSGFNPGPVFNPESAYAGSLHASNYNAAMDAAIQESNAKAGFWSALMQSGSKIAAAKYGG